MNVCMYVCLYVCMCLIWVCYVWMDVCTYVCMYVCVCVCCVCPLRGSAKRLASRVFHRLEAAFSSAASSQIKPAGQGMQAAPVFGW